MGGEAVEEPAVVGGDEGGAAVVGEAFFECLEGFDVEVVGWFIEEDDVAAAAEDFGEVDAVSFTAGEVADEFLLVAFLEVEPSAVGAGVHFGFADFEVIVAAGDFFVDGFLGVEGVA